MQRNLRLWVLALGVCLLASLAPTHNHVSAQTSTPPLRGTNTGVLGPVPLHAGLAIIHGRSNGTSNWASDLISQDPTKPSVTQDPQNGFQAFYALFNLTGAFNGSTAVMLQRDDNYYFWVTLASGNYEFSVEQPSPTTVTPVAQTNFTGKQQQVTPYFQLAAGNHSVSASSTSTSLRVYLYEVDDLGGQVIQPTAGSVSPDGRIIDANAGTPNASGVAQVSLLDSATYVIYVDAEGAGPAAWSIAIQ